MFLGVTYLGMFELIVLATRGCCESYFNTKKENKCLIPQPGFEPMTSSLEVEIANEVGRTRFLFNKSFVKLQRIGWPRQLFRKIIGYNSKTMDF